MTIFSVVCVCWMYWCDRCERLKLNIYTKSMDDWRGTSTKLLNVLDKYVSQSSIRAVTTSQVLLSHRYGVDLYANFAIHYKTDAASPLNVSEKFGHDFWHRVYKWFQIHLYKSHNQDLSWSYHIVILSLTNVSLWHSRTDTTCAGPVSQVSCVPNAVKEALQLSQCLSLNAAYQNHMFR